MKQWSIPSKYNSIVDCYAFPLLVSNKKESLKWMESNKILQKLISIINANPLTGRLIDSTDDLFCSTQSDYLRRQRSAQYNGKRILQFHVNYLILEYLGYDMGDYPPSKFFADHGDEIIESKDSLTFCESVNDINGHWRQRAVDYTAYYNCNSIDSILDGFWYFPQKNTWMRGLKSHTKIIFS
jgi:hypothetical protein